MKRAVILFISIILLAGCATTKLSNLQHNSDEAIVAGKITVYYNGKNVTDKSSILFNEIMWGTYSYRPDSTGYLITKLPLGKCHFARLCHKNFFNNLPKDLATFELSSSDSIYYLGDLTINWQGKKSKMNAGAMLGLIGALADEMSNDGKLEFYSENNYESFKEYFKSNYDNEMEILNKTLDFPHPDSLQLHKIFQNPEDNPNNLEFITKKGKSCRGTLRYVKKKKIYVECGDKLYVISRKKLASIKDNSGNDIPLESISDQEFKAINFNKYETIML